MNRKLWKQVGYAVLAALGAVLGGILGRVIW